MNKPNHIKTGHYACEFCGYTKFKTIGPAGKCKICEKEEWIAQAIKKEFLK